MTDHPAIGQAESTDQVSAASSLERELYAATVLSGLGPTTFDRHSLYVCGQIYLSADHSEVTLDGDFAADELEAIALWMRNPDAVFEAK